MDEELLPQASPTGEDDLEAAGMAVAERAATAVVDGRMPAVYLGHGAPPLVDDALWVAQLAAWAGALPRPRAILMVSAHWTEAPLTLGATAPGVPLTYDFYGFPERYYETTYPAPPAPELAERVRGLLEGVEPVRENPGRGLDHGAAVPPLRDEGVLIMGSGFLTHGLPFLRDFRPDAPPPDWSSDFDRWAAEALERRDLRGLADFRGVPSARYAHPTTEHFVPLFVTLGAADEGVPMATPITGYFLGLSKRSIQLA